MKKNILLKIAILSVFFVQMGIGTITPAIASIGGAFPQIPFTTLLLVSTLSVIVSVPATVISGRIAGSVVKYKTLLIGGMILFIVGGIAPFFAQSNFGIILALRVVFGIGLGIVTPLGAAIIISFFEGEERAKVMGLSGVVANVGGILFQLLGGVAASVLWGYAFLVHGLGVITLVLVLFLPEPEKAPNRQSGEVAPKIPSIVYLYSISLLLLMALNYPILVNMSSVIQAYGMGDAASSAVVLTMFTVGGMLAGVVFAKLFGFFKQSVISVGLILMAASMAFMTFGTTLAFMFIAATLAGIGFSMILPTMMMSIGMKVNPTLVPIASGMIMGAMNVGGFLSAYMFAGLASLFGQVENIKFPFAFSMVCFSIIAVIVLIKQLQISAKEVIQQ
ncbi:MFS transporter [Alkalibaculum sp. M08DMB]|uniref:MFS transporter n=1 Tax=Alkalibaculum sporogenes TaxID=2655001 RepID=A0A6A7KCJ2_9FIRM|nr:MFS transporter [Alkalibaculum sporogenes]MPW27238.1 MFS transporter [Alkalibaculum sporogenes]